MSAKARGGGEWTALRELADRWINWPGDGLVVLERHDNGRELKATLEALAAAAPADTSVPKVVGDKFVVANGERRFLAQALSRLDDVAPPPQDGQGAELQFVPITDAERKAYEKETAALGPPRGGSSSDLAGSSNLNVGVPPGCPKHKELMVLSFYDRPGSPPGNGWVCQSCAKERLAPSSGATGLIARWRQLQKYFWPDAEIPADEDSENANWANVGQVYRDCADDLETLMAEKAPEAVAGNASAPVGEPRKVGDEVWVRGKVVFVYHDGCLQVKFERADPMNNQIAFVEPETVCAAREVGENLADSNLRYCGTCNLRRYFREGKCEMCSKPLAKCSKCGEVAEQDSNGRDFCRECDAPVGEKREIPLCANHAETWFCERNHLPNPDANCVLCAFAGQPSGVQQEQHLDPWDEPHTVKTPVGEHGPSCEFIKDGKGTCGPDCGQPSGVGEPQQSDIELIRAIGGHVLDDRQRDRVETEALRALQMVRADTFTNVLRSDAREVGEWLREAANRAYCNYIDKLRTPECLGHEQKLKEGSFGIAELVAHRDAAELLGRHRAFAEAAALAAPAPKLELTSRDCICPTTCDGPEYNLKILPNCPWHSRAPKPAPPADDKKRQR